MSDDAGSQSLFVVLRYKDRNPYLCSILQLDDDDIHGQSDPDPEEETPPGVRVLDVKWVAHFKVEVPPRSPPLDTWVFSPPSATSAAAGDLYILPDWSSNDFGKYIDQPLYGAKFNCITKSFQEPIKPPHIFKFGGIALTVGLDVYFMIHPAFLETLPFCLGFSVFERYSPVDQSWEELDSFPKALARIGPHSSIVASAVWDDHTILLNVNHCQIWAYNVSNCKWYHVHVQGDNEAKACGYHSKYQQNRCYAIKGQAFVVQNTIYALSDGFDSVLALSIKKIRVARGKLVYHCKIHSECSVPPVSVHFVGIYGSCCDRSLALLGEDKLCVVRSLQYDPRLVDYQPIQVTYIKLMREEGKMVVTNHCIYRCASVSFHIQLCFSQPKCKTTSVASELCSTFHLNPRGLGKQVDSDEDGPLPLNIQEQEATSRRVNNSSQTKISDEQQDFEQEAVVSYLKKNLKKRKMSEINKEPEELPVEKILNMLQVVNQKIDRMLHWNI